MDRTRNAVSRRGLLLAAGGAVTATATAGDGVAQETGTATPTPETGTGTETGTPVRGGATHTVDMTDELVFDPASITIAPGDTVVWENVGTIGHSCTAYEDETPDDAAYFASGGFDSEQAARDAYSAGDPDSGDIAGGESFEHTFEVEGTFEYFCVPHESVGMIGTVEVTPGGTPGDGGGGPVVPQVPDAAKTLAVAVSVALASVLGLAYFFLKYGGEYGYPAGDDE